MKVKMLVDAPGSPDGVTVHQYETDETYEVTADLASAFLAEGLAAPVDAEQIEYVLDLPPLGSGVRAKPRRNKKAPAPAENK